MAQLFLKDKINLSWHQRIIIFYILSSMEKSFIQIIMLFPCDNVYTFLSFNHSLADVES